MASSHKSKNPNGDVKLSSQDKSIEVKIIDGRDVKMRKHILIEENSLETFSEPMIEEVKISESKIEEIKNITPPVSTKKLLKKEFDVLVGNPIKYDFDDILIIPKSQSNIKSRYNDVNPYYNDDFSIHENRLPLMTAPMDSVVSVGNMFKFQRNKINVVLPRTENFKAHALKFNSFGLYESIDNLGELKYALIDVANGHMSLVLDWCNKLKKKYPKVKIIAGNIANPQTFNIYSNSGVIDYARIGIGNGNGCLTTQNTGVGYPMASLIAECYDIKIRHNNPIKIVADGGMKDYADIIKALAIGADYVMIGSIFAKLLESSAPSYFSGFKVNDKIAKFLFDKNLPIYKEFRGMSTKEVQKLLGKNNIKTSEGVIRRLKVEYTLEKWVENFEHYLRSAMSYSNANNLNNFIGNANYTVISNNALNRFKK